jgi:hypothetical protein
LEGKNQYVNGVLIVQGWPTKTSGGVTSSNSSTRKLSSESSSIMVGCFLEIQFLEVLDFHIPRCPVENEEVVVEEAAEEVVEDALVPELVELQLTAAGA